MPTNIVEQIYETTKHETHAALFYVLGYTWAAIVITNEMVHNKVQPVYIANNDPSEDVDQLREKIKEQFPHFRGGFTGLNEMWTLLKNAGMPKPDLASYPEETHFLSASLKYIWED